jgi:hypothetical protein
MPEVEQSVEVAVGIDEVWRYVENLENWAPYVIGFQQLQVVDDRRSIWTVRGDLGILSREVELQADITLWQPRDRVEFTVTGLTERLEGDGHFVLRPSGPSAAPATPDPVLAGGEVQPAARRGRRHRLQAAWARFLLRRLTKRQATAPPAMTSESPPDRTSDDSECASVLSFRLRISPGGPMAPMLELLMGPMLEPAAEDLAAQIKGSVEGSAGASISG